MTDYTPTKEEVMQGFRVGPIIDPRTGERSLLIITREQKERWLAALREEIATEVREGVAREIEDWFHTDEHPGMTRSEAEIYEETVATAAKIARNQGPALDGGESGD